METTLKALIIAALAGAAVVASADLALAQRGPDIVPMGRNAAGQPVCPSNYVVQGNSCVSIYAGRRGGPDAVPIGRNAAGQPSCPSNFVVRGNACVSIYAKQPPATAGGGYGARQGGGYQGPPPGYQGDYRRGYDRDDYDDRPRRRRYRDDYDAGPPRGRAAVEPFVNRYGELQCPSNYVFRRGLCVSLY